MKRVFAIAALALAACYAPHLDDGQFTCSRADPRCPAGQICDPCSARCVAAAHACTSGWPALDAAAAPDLAAPDLGESPDLLATPDLAVADVGERSDMADLADADLGAGADLPDASDGPVSDGGDDAATPDLGGAD